MKTRLIFYCLILLFFSMEAVHAQYGLIGGSSVPLKPQSPLFGKDIVIQDSSGQNQQNVKICSAFNGWLYSVFTYNFEDYPYLTLLKSVDNGLTWTVLVSSSLPYQNASFESVDLVTSGDSLSNLKLFLSFMATSAERGDGDGYINRYNGVTGDYEARLFFSSPVYDIALASDFMDPSPNTSPNSIGVLYSKAAHNIDSIIFLSSSNGGNSLDRRQVLDVTGSLYHKVALAYGKSSSFNSGIYFASWEERDAFGSIPGRIYTSHSYPAYNSPFTMPVELDGLDPATFNLCNNPTIACQFKVPDNDSSNLSELIMFEKRKPSSNQHEIQAYFNSKAATTAHFEKFNITDTSLINLQPSLKFNPFDSTFVCTYFDSTEKKLPYLIKNYNLQNPNNWLIISPGYNDSSNLSNAMPKMDIDYELHGTTNVWIADRSNGKGIALLDVSTNNYAGFSNHTLPNNNMVCSIYPNPCNYILHINITLMNTGEVTISIYDFLGQLLAIPIKRIMHSGISKEYFDVTSLPIGNYLCKIENENNTIIKKFIVIK